MAAESPLNLKERYALLSRTVRKLERERLTPDQIEQYKIENLSIDKGIEAGITGIFPEIKPIAERARTRLLRFLSTHEVFKYKFRVEQVFCTNDDIFFLNQRSNWTCGYKNAQMLLSALFLNNKFNTPVSEGDQLIQRLILPCFSRNDNRYLPKKKKSKSFWQKTLSLKSSKKIKEIEDEEDIIPYNLDDRTTDERCRRKLADIESMQALIERSWNLGFDEEGGKEFFQGELIGKKNWIGTVEITAMLRSFGFRTKYIDFDFTKRYNIKKASTPPTAKKPKKIYPDCLFLEQFEEENHINFPLVEFIWNYFSGKPLSSFVPELEREKEKYYHEERTFITPLYFQHQGHSRTIVGVERIFNDSTKAFQTNFLVFNPLKQPKDLKKKFPNVVRMNSDKFMKEKYQAIFILEDNLDRGIMSSEEFISSFELEPIAIYY